MLARQPSQCQLMHFVVESASFTMSPTCTMPKLMGEAVLTWAMALVLCWTG